MADVSNKILVSNPTRGEVKVELAAKAHIVVPAGHVVEVTLDAEAAENAAAYGA
jgi:hypothetical protein